MTDTFKDSYVLTGVKPTGIPHIGNYVGVIRPMIELANSNQFAGSFMFIANYHALNGLKDADILQSHIKNIARIYLSLGLNPDKTNFYKQSDVPEIFELQTILNPFTAKGLMNRAHAYKAIIDQDGNDDNVNIGLYTYPILMAADILMFGVKHKVVVPIGQDQRQHIEIARDIAGTFNYNYNVQSFVLPDAYLQKDVAELPGTDGRKMSKSYGNVVPIFGNADEIKTAVMSIKTDSRGPTEPKPDFADNLIYKLYKNFANPFAHAEMADALRDGKMGYGDAKKLLLSALIEHFAAHQEKYNYYKTPTGEKEIFELLAEGAKKARVIASENLQEIKSIIKV
ncbi:MAG: tryptophan--tRNA ligase [Rickettsiales bacterium]|jgi:tryptophanyl-tRNA synthetase|nr:tryptophan--tRNA ligase [Rickettsiales bacterium]